MKIYLGFTGNKNVAEFMRKYDCGWGFNPTNYSMNFKESFFLDNGCFTAYKTGRAWDEVAFYDYLRKFVPYKPDFTVIPDIVAGGMDSWDYSLKHLNRIPRPRYIAVQDGMFSNTVHKYLIENGNTFDGIFVGGTVLWKMQTAKMWTDTAHLHKLKCHVGRIGTFQGYTLCDQWDVDSVDGTNPSRNNNERPLKMWAEQQRLFEYDLMDVSE
jgi:hypothetical protein